MTVLLIVSIAIIWTLLSAIILISVAIHSSRISQAEEMAARGVEIKTQPRRNKQVAQQLPAGQHVDS